MNLTRPLYTRCQSIKGWGTVRGVGGPVGMTRWAGGRGRRREVQERWGGDEGIDGVTGTP
jgi:hypothetical protein